MSSVATGFIVLVCVFGGAVLGMFLRTVLPKHHLDSETKDSSHLPTVQSSPHFSLLVSPFRVQSL